MNCRDWAGSGARGLTPAGLFGIALIPAAWRRLKPVAPRFAPRSPVRRHPARSHSSCHPVFGRRPERSAGRDQPCAPAAEPAHVQAQSRPLRKDVKAFDLLRQLVSLRVVQGSPTRQPGALKCCRILQSAADTPQNGRNCRAFSSPRDARAYPQFSECELALAVVGSHCRDTARLSETGAGFHGKLQWIEPLAKPCVGGNCKSNICGKRKCNSFGMLFCGAPGRCGDEVTTDGKGHGCTDGRPGCC